MRVRVLGSAAGGGFPQWNCNCRVCAAARDLKALPRTQSSIAVRGETGPWFVVNSSPDLRQQLAELPVDRSNGIRATPIGGVILTDAEIDHTAGLLLLRESSTPIQVYCIDDVRLALTEHYPVLSMLEHYCGVEWRRLEPAVCMSLQGSSLEVEPFETGGDPPLYVSGTDGPGSVGLMIREPTRGRTVCYAPALETLDEELAARMRACDCVLADGTFWREDELVSLGLSTRGARAMGHTPLSGSGGTLEKLATLGPRTILIHINNTNPVLLEDSPERAIAQASHVEPAYDGLEIEL